MESKDSFLLREKKENLEINTSTLNDFPKRGSPLSSSLLGLEGM